MSSSASFCSNAHSLSTLPLVLTGPSAANSPERPGFSGERQSDLEIA